MEKGPKNFTKTDFILCAALAPTLTLGVTLGLMKLINMSENAKNFQMEDQLLKEKRLTELQQIVDLREVPGFDFQGNVPSIFSFEDGDFQGKTVRKLKFAWRPKGEDNVQISSVPSDNVRYVTNDYPNIAPSVLFTGMKPDVLLKGEKDVFNSDDIGDFVNKAAVEPTIFILSKGDLDNFKEAQVK